MATPFFLSYSGTTSFPWLLEHLQFLSVYVCMHAPPHMRRLDIHAECPFQWLLHLYFSFYFFTFLLTGLSQALSFTEPEAHQLVGMAGHQLVPPPQPWDCRGQHHTLLLTCVLRTCPQVPVLVQQMLYWSSHLFGTPRTQYFPRVPPTPPLFLLSALSCFLLMFQQWNFQYLLQYLYRGAK